jgi:cytidine deaminase
MGRDFLSIINTIQIMATNTHSFEFERYKSASDLPPADRELLEIARNSTSKAYAPYSHFFVAAVARLEDGTTVCGTNQENASYPVGICAERTLLSTLATQFAGKRVEAIAISYLNGRGGQSDTPASPCGLCRQSLLEYEQRLQQPLRLILAGQMGEVIVVKQAKDLLPFAFSKIELQ